MSKEMFRRIREISGKSLNPALKCIRSSNGMLLTDPNHWNEYIRELFHDERQNNDIYSV